MIAPPALHDARVIISGPLEPETRAIVQPRALVVPIFGWALDDSTLQRHMQNGSAQGLGQCWCQAVCYDGASGTAPAFVNMTMDSMALFDVHTVTAPLTAVEEAR